LVLDGIHILISSIYMSQMRNILRSGLVIGLILFAASGEAIEKNKGGFQSTKLGFIQQTYSGITSKSFAQGSPGLGLELTLDSGNSVFRYFFKSRFTMSQGEQSFLNAGTAFTSKYKFSQFAPELGLSFFPIPRREKGVNIFLWGTGTISYNNLELKTLPSPTSLKSKEQAFGYGYGGGIGIELIIAPGKKGSRYLAYAELGFRHEQADLVNTKFEISGMTYSVGVGF